ncbi:tyrosine protein kinase:Serine/threonine protein kinase [Actinoplanes sp. N902-109]|nr:tyrosine protein kinase:Serine/threonine protein kinase [Actinoplanes sp. N902-109]
MPLRTGEPARLGAYELVGRLGSGGMGTVYLGRAGDGRPVAIKVIRHELSWDDELRGRFRSEVNRARQVPAFSTAAVLDADVDHDPPYLVVEYVDGPSLAKVIRERGPLGPDALHSTAVGIATALVAIHGAGVIHRDLKPGNVLLALGGVKVIDFGIARPMEMTSQHTGTDQMVGTVEYMAPERFDSDSSRTVSPAADIFGWGVVLAYAATGRTPFAAPSPPATAMRILTEPPNLTGLTGSLRDLVARALAKRPEDRPTARELLDALLTGTAPGRAPVPAPAAPPAARPVPRPRQAPGSMPVPQAWHTPPPAPAWAAAPRTHPSTPARGWTPPPGHPVSYQSQRRPRRRTRAFVALMVATGLLGTVLGVVVLHELGTAVNGDDRGPGPVTEYKDVTPAAMVELLTQLLPERRLTNPRRTAANTVQVGVSTDGEPATVTISVKGPPADADRYGSPAVKVSPAGSDCLRNRTVAATWDDGTAVQAALATCVVRDGKKDPTPAALTIDEATDLVSDTHWGTRMDATTVDAGAEHYPSLTS